LCDRTAGDRVALNGYGTSVLVSVLCDRATGLPRSEV
jgi:hypothetical protein